MKPALPELTINLQIWRFYNFLNVSDTLHTTSKCGGPRRTRPWFNLLNEVCQVQKTGWISLPKQATCGGRQSDFPHSFNLPEKSTHREYTASFLYNVRLNNLKEAMMSRTSSFKRRWLTVELLPSFNLSKEAYNKRRYARDVHSFNFLKKAMRVGFRPPTGHMRWSVVRFPTLL